MRVNVAIPETHVSAPVLDAALEAVTRLNEALIKSGAAPTFKEALPHVRWKPEPPGAEHFDNAAIVSARGWGDCDDLAPHHAASLRLSGEDPGAKAIVVPSGPQRWHAVVKRSNGTIDDPSIAAGMGQHNGHAIAGAALPMMCEPAVTVSGVYVLRPQVAIRPTPNGWQARTDLPWNWRDTLGKDFSMSALHQAPVAATALNGALDGAIELAEACHGAADEEHLDRLRCMSDYVAGVPLHELAEVYGHDHARAVHSVVGSFWSHITNAAKHLASPVAHLAATPFHAASHLARGQFGNLLHDVTSPVTHAMHLAQPLAHLAQPFTPFMRMVPGVGPMAASAADFLNRPPMSPMDVARFAAQQAPGFIPGMGPAMAAAHAWPTLFQ